MKTDKKDKGVVIIEFGAKKEVLRKVAKEEGRSMAGLLKYLFDRYCKENPDLLK